MSTEIGDLTSAGTVQQTRRTYRNNGTKQIEYVVSSSNEATFLGSYTLGTSTDDGLFLESIDVTSNKGVSRAVLTFVPEAQLATTTDGANYSTDTGTSEDEDGKIIPIVTYTKTETVDSFTFTQSNVLGDVGTLQAPEGMTGTVTVTKWLNSGQTVTPNGDKFTIVKTWSYNPDGWGGYS